MLLKCNLKKHKQNNKDAGTAANPFLLLVKKMTQGNRPYHQKEPICLL